MPKQQYLHAHTLIACKYMCVASIEAASYSISSYSIDLVRKAWMEICYITVSFDCQQERTVLECLVAGEIP